MGSLVTTSTMIGSTVLVTLLATGVRSQYASYGPVDLEAVDPLSMSWNQIHWLVKNQIKEVEELKAEHDEIYNEIAGCYGLEKCLTEFDLVDIKPGTKLWNLGLRKVDLSMSEFEQAEGRAGADESGPQRSDEGEAPGDDQAGGDQDSGVAEAETGADEAGGD